MPLCVTVELITGTETSDEQIFGKSISMHIKFNEIVAVS